MANDEKTTQSLDADILQCKADILKALRAKIPAPSEDLDLSDDTPEPTSKVIQKPITPSKPEIIDTDFEPEQVNKPPVQHPKQAPIRIKPFEATQQKAPARQPATAAKPQAEKQPEPESVKKPESTQSAGIPMVSANELRQAQLEDKLKAEQIENAALNKQIQSLQQAVQRTAQQLEDETASLKASLQTAAENFDQQTEKLTSERDALRNQLVSQESLLDQFKQLQQELTELRQLEQINGQLQKDLQQQKVSLVEGRKSQQRLNEKIGLLQKQKSQTEANLKRLGDEYIAHKQQAEQSLQAMRQDNDRLTRQNQELTEKASAIDEQMETFKELQANLQAYQQQIQHLRAELTETESALSQERVRIRQLQSEIKEYDEQAATLGQSQDEINQRLGVAEDEKRALLDDRDSLQKDFTNFQTQASREIGHLSEKMTRMRDEKQMLQDDFDMLKAEHEAYLTQANGEITQLNDTNSELKTENQRLYNNIEQLGHEISILKTKTETLEAQSGQMNQLHAELEQNRQELNSQREVEDKLRAEIIAIQQQSDSLSTEQDHLIEKLKDENQTLLDSNAQLQNELSVLGDNLAQSTETSAEEAFTQDDSRQSVWDDETSEQLEEILNEQPRDDIQIPSFNLADQIMAEHRRSVATRRQRVKSTEVVSKPDSIKGVVQQYVTSAAQQGKKSAHAPCHDLWKDDSLSQFQQDILQEIVQKDIELYTHHNVGINRGHSLMYY